MDPSLLDVVTVISNPIRWRSRIDLYHKFAAHVLASGARLTLVECAYGDRPFELNNNPAIQHIGVRAKIPVWVKECLINIGVARLSDNWKYVLVADADIFFRNPYWATEIVHALQHYDIIQPWSECYDLGPQGQHIKVDTSFCKIAYQGKPILQGPNLQKSYAKFAHPGYAWALTRDAFRNLGGFIDTAALGAADHHMALALIGKVEDSIPTAVTEEYKAPLFQWQERATQYIRENIGFLPITIEHSWHGSRIRRAYVDRWDILIKHKFNPQTDLKRNEWGVWELTGNKPALVRDIDRYFRARFEDSNMMEDD